MIRTFSSKTEERRLKIPSEETKHTSVPPTSKINTQVKSISFNEKETSEDPRRR